MGDGFGVETEQVSEAAAGLSKLTADLDEIVSYASEADPEWWMWGTVGVPFSQPYQQCADSVREILAKLGPAAEGLAKKIRDCADDYDETDREQCEAIERWGSELNGGFHV